MKQPTKEQIKALRLQKGLTQEQAAEIMHVTTSTWQKWEQGINPMMAALWELFLIKTEDKWLEYLDFNDENDGIGHWKKTTCYETLAEAVRRSLVKEGEGTVVCAKEKGILYWSFVPPIPTSYTMTIDKLKEIDFDFRQLAFQYVWDNADVI